MRCRCVAAAHAAVHCAAAAQPFDSCADACYILLMKILQGIAASNGLARGSAFVLSARKRRQNADKTAVAPEQIDEDWQRFENARKQTADYFTSLIDTSNKRQAEIFQTYILMLSDPDFLLQIKTEHQKQCVCIEWVVQKKVEEACQMLRSANDPYLTERAEDISDVYGKVLDMLAGSSGEHTDEVPENAVLAAISLSPADAVWLSKHNVSAVLLQEGSKNSHLAILARSYGIPLIFGISGIEDYIHSGDSVIADGETGYVFVQPDKKTSDEYRKKEAEYETHKKRLALFAGKRAQTKDGFEINLYANIGSVEEARIALKEGADGIGLFRTEFLFMNSENTGHAQSAEYTQTAADEEAQFNTYKEVLNIMGKRPVVIRTLDAGADKIVNIPELKEEAEKNPLLGNRAIRLSLSHPDIFKTQLRALLRAGVYGNLKIMLPLITDIGEIVQSKELIEQAKKELKEQGIAFNENIPVGIMVETPAAALTVERMAKHAAFFSIGSNDLTQYTLCIDRESTSSAKLFEELHPAVTGLIRKTVEAARTHNIPVSVCGEMAGKPSSMLFLLALGITSFSTAARNLCVLKETLARFTLEQIRSLQTPEDYGSAAQLKKRLENFLR